MNIIEAFATYLQSQGYGTLGSTIFIGRVPQNAPDACYWLVSAGGDNVTKNKTGERIKEYRVLIYYRSMNAKDVYNNLQTLESNLNSAFCITLSGYDTIEIQANSYGTDQDIDNEERTKGLIQATLTIYN